MSDYILHRASGWTKPGHKYIDRFKKNGKWFYVYKNGKKYNKIQDWLGVDERDAENASYKDMEQEAEKVRRFYNEAPGSKQHNREVERYKSVIKVWENNYDKYKKTPLGKIESIANRGSEFISSIPNKIKKK